MGVFCHLRVLTMHRSQQGLQSVTRGQIMQRLFWGEGEQLGRAMPLMPWSRHTSLILLNFHTTSLDFAPLSSLP